MARYQSYGSYGERLGNFFDGAICIEVNQTVRQRPLIVSAAMLMTNTLSPTPEQKAGYARVVVYTGTVAAAMSPAIALQSSFEDLRFLGVDRILVNHVFPINSGFSLVMPAVPSSIFSAQENQGLGAILLCPCDQLGVGMDGLGSLTFYGMTVDATDTPQYKVI